MPEERPDQEGPDDLNEPPSFFPRDTSADGEDEGPRELVLVSIEAVYQREESGTVERFVVLADNLRRLPIVIDPCNARAISLPLDGSVPDRPLTHDLLKSCIERLGGEVLRVLIDDLWSTTYYAKIVIKRKNDEFEIDARPSDAIALAVRCGAEVYVSESILESAGE